MPLFQRGSRFGNSPNFDRWLVTRKLGEGQFAEVYEVRDTYAKERDLKYAVKIEKRKESKTVKQECKVLKKLGQSHRQVCQVYDTGTHDDRYYIVMELLGENLVEARRAQPGGCFVPSAVGSIGASLLAALEALHEGGYIHRDVKPANFALTLPHPSPATGTWAVIDFGLARRYVGEGGEVLAARSDAAFRGSTTYASVHAHRQQDQGRRDDLWSWLYMLVELLEGTLPWRADKDVEPVGREPVLQWKEACLAHPTALSSTNNLPEPLVQISRHIESLSFADAPDYALLRHHLSSLAACPSPASAPAAAWTLPRPMDSYYQAPASTSPGDGLGQSPPGEGTDPYPTSTYPTARDASDAADVGPSPASPFASTAAAAAAGHQWHKRPLQDPDPGDPLHGRPPRRPRTEDGSRERAANGVHDAGGASGSGGLGAGADEEEEERVQDVRGFVQRFREGQVSAEALAAVRALCGLDPAEGLAALATTCELLLTRTQPAGMPQVASFLHSLAAYSRDAARRAMGLHPVPPAAAPTALGPA